MMVATTPVLKEIQKGLQSKDFMISQISAMEVRLFFSDYSSHIIFRFAPTGKAGC